MSEDHLLLIITQWKNEAYELSRQLEFVKNDYQEQLNQIQNEKNFRKIFLQTSLIKNEDILKQLLRNVNQSSISDQLSVLCDFFVDSLKTLLLSIIIDKKQQSTLEFPSILEN